ncbi:hypothetical protein ACFWDI_03680 [Streptomyces sp. NPDC060064]|uniref:hypothetical protein n=1 Tax=Streptomyces sp. NPDC060064 TaxID=3347049 RepID=UPI0036CD8A3B
MRRSDEVDLGAPQQSDGPVNGKFTEVLLKVWDNGSFSGGYRAFHRDILCRMPADRSPNFHLAGRAGDEFVERRPCTVRASRLGPGGAEVGASIGVFGRVTAEATH